MKEDVTTDSIFPLLYIAHLFQATGDHLEAMKIYSVVTSLFMEDSPAVAPLKVDFLPEMFPRPYNNTVESLSREWGADPDFIYAIMRQESAFNPGCRLGRRCARPDAADAFAGPFALAPVELPAVLLR